MHKSLRIIAFISFCQATLPAQQFELNPADRHSEVIVAPQSDEALAALDHFDLSQDLRASLWASEPMLANPIAISFDERGRLFVAETHRYRTSVLDIRDYPEILERDLASRTVEDRAQLIEEAFGEEATELAIESETVRLIEDTNGDGVADESHVFATEFRSPLDGMVGGILARNNQIWLANIPSLWKLTLDASETKAALREEVLRGFGVHFGFSGHDLHGLAIGPDGKLYFSVGDRGTHVSSTDTRSIDIPDTGSIFRCNPNGRQLEVVATGLRNPTDLAFDDFGNLFAADGGSVNGDPARLVYIVEGSDSGWRIGHQFSPLGKGDHWKHADLLKASFENRPTYMLPPVCNIENGPSGLAYYPGTGLTREYTGHFFLSHFKNSLKHSGITTYTLKSKGAGFEMIEAKPFLREAQPTDLTFGPDHRLYFSDWISGWPKSQRGRIYAVEPRDPEVSELAAAEETTRLIATGMNDRPPNELAELLGHPDQRVRYAAQFELANRGKTSLSVFQNIADNINKPIKSRLHALWGIAQLATDVPHALNAFPLLLKDKDSEVRAQAAKLIGDTNRFEHFHFLIAALQDPEPRVAFFAAQSLGKLKRKPAIPALIHLLRRNDNKDLVLRQAVVVALARLGPDPALAKTVNDPSRAVRLGGLLAYRHLEDPAIALLLEDFDPNVVREAARAINDVPIEGAIPALAALLELAPLDDYNLVLRAINAHFRLGMPENAKALADFAGRPYVPANLRAEALKQLGMWSKPPDRDRLTGLYKPLSERDPEPAREALSEFLSNLSRKVPEEVQVATINAVKELEIPGTGHALWDVVYQSVHSVAARIAALQALEKMGDLRLEVAAATAASSKHTEMRLAAIPVLARLHPEVSLPIFRKLADNGTAIEQRTVFSSLAGIENPQAEEILIQALDRLVAGELPVAAQAELLDSATASSDPEVSTKAIQIQDEWSTSTDRLAPYRSALDGGDVSNGRRLFETHPVMTCTRCHEPGKIRREIGPSLERIGSEKTKEELLDYVAFHNDNIDPGLEHVALTLVNGESETGIVLHEDEVDLELRRADGMKVAVLKSQIAARKNLASSMPENYGQVLSRTELRDLMAFLSDLKD